MSKTKFEFDPLNLRPDPRDFEDVVLTEDQILALFGACDAYWMHNGSMKNPHAELTSGLCSNGFFDCLRVLRHPNICEILARQLAKKLERGAGIVHVDWTASSPYAAITFGHETAKPLGAIAGFGEKDYEIEKDPATGKPKLDALGEPKLVAKIVWRRGAIPRNATVLQVEELITTSKTFSEMRRAIMAGNDEPVTFSPVVATLVHRPPELPMRFGDTRVISLIERKVWAVKPEFCPLCKAGSKRLRPKTHWAELTGKA